jgi:hypothetical protein
MTNPTDDNTRGSCAPTSDTKVLLSRKKIGSGFPNISMLRRTLLTCGVVGSLAVGTLVAAPAASATTEYAISNPVPAAIASTGNGWIGSCAIKVLAGDRLACVKAGIIYLFTPGTAS